MNIILINQPLNSIKEFKTSLLVSRVDPISSLTNPLADQKGHGRYYEGAECRCTPSLAAEGIPLFVTLSYSLDQPPLPSSTEINLVTCHKYDNHQTEYE